MLARTSCHWIDLERSTGVWKWRFCEALWWWTTIRDVQTDFPVLPYNGMGAQAALNCRPILDPGNSERFIFTLDYFLNFVWHFTKTRSKTQVGWAITLETSRRHKSSSRCHEKHPTRLSPPLFRSADQPCRKTPGGSLFPLPESRFRTGKRATK